MKNRLAIIWTLMTVGLLTGSIAMAAGPSSRHGHIPSGPSGHPEAAIRTPVGPGQPACGPTAVAPLFVEMMGDRYGLPTESEDLELVRVRESLLGFHHVFQQKIARHSRRRAEFIVSVAKKDDRVYRVFNNTYPVKIRADADHGRHRLRRRL